MNYIVNNYFMSDGEEVASDVLRGICSFLSAFQRVSPLTALYSSSYLSFLSLLLFPAISPSPYPPRANCL